MFSAPWTPRALLFDPPLATVDPMNARLRDWQKHQLAALADEDVRRRTAYVLIVVKLLSSDTTGMRSCGHKVPLIAPACTYAADPTSIEIVDRIW